MSADKWCREHGIHTGGDYLRWYTAKLVRFPKDKLPYLFLVSEGEQGQETGKSTWARAVDLLFARGSADGNWRRPKVDLDWRLVFCWLEEAALSREAYLRIKQWVDAPRMTIRALRRDGYSIPNYAHFTQSGNKQDNCPFELGDTRVVVIEVPPLDPEEWGRLEGRLDSCPGANAPSFFGRLYGLPLPARGYKRLYLPVLATTAKTMLAAMRRQSEEKEGRRTLMQALIDLAKCGKWKGTAEELNPGPWPVTWRVVEHRNALRASTQQDQEGTSEAEDSRVAQPPWRPASYRRRGDCSMSLAQFMPGDQNLQAAQNGDAP